MDAAFVIRGVGAGLGCLVPGWKARAAVVAGSYVAAWYAGEHGIQVLSVTGYELPTSALSWTALHVAAGAGLRRLPLPQPLTAAAYAGLVAWADQLAIAAVRAKLETVGVAA